MPHKRKTVLKVFSLSIILLGCLFIYLNQEDSTLSPKKHARVSNNEKTATSRTPINNALSLPPAQTVQGGKSDAATSPFFEKEVKARLIQVRDQYAEDIKYPPFSQPIRNTDELKMFTPNRSIASSIKTDLKDENAPSISLKPLKYEFMSGEPIQARATITGLAMDQYTSVSARLVANHKTIAEVVGIPSDDAATYQYDLIFGNLDYAPDAKPQTMMIVATFNIEGEVYEIASPIKYFGIVAMVDRVGSPHVKSEYLEIPVHIVTSQPGFHKVTGNLYDAETGQALIHLSAKKKLTREKDVILLKAHIAALKLMGSEGPYELKDMSLIRMPSSPTYITESGAIPQTAYAVAGFPFNAYKDIPYYDEKAQQRLEFLSQIGGEH